VRAAGHPAADCTPQGITGYGTWVSANIPAGGVTSTAFAELLKGPANLPMNSKAVDGASDIEKIQIVIRVLLGMIEGGAAVASVKVTAAWKTARPLERNQKKAQGNGKEGQAVITVTLAPTKNPKVPECIRDIIQNIVKAGPVSKAQVKVSGGAGFPGGNASDVFVIFKQPKPDSVTTSSNGQATIAILGRQQSKDVPTPLRPYIRKATLLLTPAATGKPIGDIKSIADAIEFFWRSQESVNLDVKDWGSHYAFFVKWKDQFPRSQRHPFGGITCGGTSNGKWAFISTQLDEVRLNAETIVPLANQEKVVFKDVKQLGGKFEVAGESDYNGSIKVVKQLPGKPPVLRLTISANPPQKWTMSQDVQAVDINPQDKVIRCP
jgi:hypothetical protein